MDRDPIREKVDGAETFRPRSKANRPGEISEGGTKPEAGPKGRALPRKLLVKWADEIVLDFTAGGLIDGFLPRSGIAVLYGASGSAKTFNAVDMACHVAAGRQWRGLDVEQGIVIYIAAEAPASVERRIWAWKKRHGVEHLPVLVVQSTVDFLNGDAAAILELVRTVAVEHGRVAMVVVDTLARAMTGNENSPEDMGRFVGACGQIREASDGTVLVVHHSGKDEARGARGHSSLRAATDVELECSAIEGNGTLRVTKSRDDEGAKVFGFKLESVELGENSKGRMVTTCVAVEAEPPENGTKNGTSGQRRVSASGRVFVDAVRSAIDAEPEKPPYHEETSGVVAAVKVDRLAYYWRQKFDYGSMDKLEKEASKKTRQRGMCDALAAGLVKKWGEFLWLVSP